MIYWDIMFYYLLPLFCSIIVVILNYIIYKFKNRLINILTILSVTFGLYWFPFGINGFKYLEFMTYFCGNDDGVVVYLIAFSIMTTIDIFIINRIYKSNKKVFILSKILFILSIITLILILAPSYNDYITTSILCKVIQYIEYICGICVLLPFLLKPILTVLLFIFLLYKTIVLLIQKNKDRIKQ